MSTFLITGGKTLHGTSHTPGAKNAVLPLLAASLLFDAPIHLTNVPHIRDVEVFCDILRHLGSVVEDHGTNEILIKPQVKKTDIPLELAQRLRASVLLLGPLLARTGEVRLANPGGDLIGRRPIDMHLRGLEQMGYTTHLTETDYVLTGQSRPSDLYLEEASVTATENVLLAAALGYGTTTITHAAEESHVTALAEFLRRAGLEIDGIGTSKLTIIGRAGKPFTRPITFAVPPDELDAGTFAIAALVTRSELTIDPYPSVALRPFTEKLRQIGAKIEVDGQRSICQIRRYDQLTSFSLKVGPAPAFPTDLQPPMAVLATQATGTSLIHDWMYERRFGYVDSLDSFGANITVCDPHRILISGPTPFRSRHIYSLDIRAGIAFVLAAMIAKGTSRIDHADIVERGYAHLSDRLTKLGADVQYVVE